MTLPALGFRRHTGMAARFPLLWLASRLDINAQSGQAGTFTSTGISAIPDTFGTNGTAVSGQPPWGYHSGRQLVGLFPTSGNSHLSWNLPLVPQAMCGIIDFIENGTLLTFSAGLLDIQSASTGAGARIYIAVQPSGTKTYELVYTDGTTTRKSTMASTVPANGDRCQIRWSLSSTGQAQMWQSVNGAAEVAGSTPATTALPAGWSGSSFRLNRTEAANYGINIFLGAVVSLGSQTQAVLQGALT